MILYVVIVISAVLMRLVPHAWNFAPVTAIAIVAGIYLPKKQAIVLPLAVRFISDAIIGFFSWPLMLGVYAAHVFGALAGLWVRQHKSFARILAAPIASAIVFFLVTNFAFLYAPSEYPHTASGIVQAYANGLPFFRGTLLGDIIYTLALVGAWELVLYYHNLPKPVSALVQK